MSNLLPCPFCGSTNLRHEFAGSQGYIECNECGTQGPCDERAADPICDFEAAYKAWNRRAALAKPCPPTEGEVAELARLLRLDAELERNDGMPQAAARLDRAALAEPQPPADGEVASMITALACAAKYGFDDRVTAAQTLRRAADLLERLSDGPTVQSREPASVTTEPSDEELLELMPQQMRDDLAAAARALAGFDPDNIKAASVFRIILNCHVADYARAALARWGTAAPQPILVSERLPEAGDCDAEGMVWAWRIYKSDDDDDDGDFWMQVPAEWLPLWTRCWTHWLPAHALPLPTPEAL
jgi:Lar family restriction alleviation protein